MPNPSLSLDAQVAAYNALRLDRPFRLDGMVARSIGGLSDVTESETRLPDEADVYRLAAQIQAFAGLHGGRIVGCNAAGEKWQPSYKKEGR